MITIQRFGREFSEGNKCPACSGSRDKGGRLAAKKRVNVFLKCARCKYTIHSERVVIAQMQKHQARRDKAIGFNAKRHV
jgi:uncharacterized Zn finger protein